MDYFSGSNPTGNLKHNGLLSARQLNGLILGDLSATARQQDIIGLVIKEGPTRPHSAETSRVYDC